MKFEFNWPSGFIGEAGVTGILLANPSAFGSGELNYWTCHLDLIHILIKFHENIHLYKSY